MAVISQGSMSQIDTLRVAGDTFDEEITRHMREKYGVLIGKRMAEEIKNRISALCRARRMSACRRRAAICFPACPALWRSAAMKIHEC